MGRINVISTIFFTYSITATHKKHGESHHFSQNKTYLDSQQSIKVVYNNEEKLYQIINFIGNSIKQQNVFF